MLSFKNDTFKILQIADTQEGKKISPDTLDLINSALDRVEPDLVVYSGDQIWGKRTFKGNRDAIKNSLDILTKPCRSRKIPFTICFGNHDRQVGLSNEEQFEIYKEFDYFIGESEKDIDGCANHIIEIKDGDELKFLLYLIDSHSNLEIGYDNVHENQIEWYKKKRDSYEEKYGHLIPSIVIQHIPVCEIFELLNEVKKNTKGAVRGFRTHANRFYVLNKDKVNANGFMNIVFYTIEFVFLTALFLLLLFAHGFYRPLHRLTIVSESYAKGNFEPRTQIHRNDELGYLANTMDYMANELDTLEEDQRKFISNVSHDFRSPLTSIKGYIEAMLDGTIPPELQNKYLNIILFETERLTKLTQGILDLNRFGQHRGMMLDLTDFDINRMIKTTILTFEGTCSAKGLSFDLVLTGQKLYVHGDMSKIQQVLYNLIDNATKFSHNDASIKIETSIKNEKVLISVKDSGIGIPAESIKKIWDRFYKTDLSRGKDKRGTGLGLAIVKEIIQAHNEHINVISTEGVGTEFIFTLPLAKKEVQS